MIEEFLYRYAKEKGILLGICGADKIDPISSVDYTAIPFVTKDIERRINPDKILKGSKSIIAVGVRYDNDDAFTELRSDGSKAFCRITKMSPSDYHLRVKAILRDIVEHVIEQYGTEFKYRLLVDSGSLIEREYARRAGLGFIGKNMMLISSEIGSFFNIGLLLTELDLMPTVSREYEPMLSGCGDCARCIDACPAALRGTLTESNCDVEKCISYITQARGIIEHDRRKLLNGYIYGCDICQNVCPYNTDRSEILLDAEKLSKMTEDEFINVFGKTSMNWIGYEVFKRNVDYSLTRNLLK